MSSDPGGDDPAAQRLSKGQRRINAILSQIPDAREQLLVAMEDLSPRWMKAPAIRGRVWRRSG